MNQHHQSATVSNRQRTWLRRVLTRSLKSTFVVPALGVGLLAGGAMTSAYADTVTINVSGSEGSHTQADEGYSIIADTSVSNPTTLEKGGWGELVLNSANTYTGGTHFYSGALGLSNNAGLGAGTLTTGAAVSNALTLNYANGITINNTILNQTSTHALEMNVASGSATQAGAITGSGGIAKIGDGRLILSGDNSYAGDTDLQAGKLQLNHNNALGLGDLHANGGGLEYYLDGINTGNDIVLDDNLQIFVNDNVFATESGVISGTNGIVKTGGGQLTLSGENVYSGGTRLNNGTLRVETDNALGADSGSLTVDNNNNDKTLDYGAGVAIDNDIVLNGELVVNVDNGVAQQNGNITDNGIDSGIVKTGAGKLVLNGDNTYTGTGVVEGTLRNNGSLEAYDDGYGFPTFIYAGNTGRFVNAGTVGNDDIPAIILAGDNSEVVNRANGSMTGINILFGDANLINRKDAVISGFVGAGENSTVTNRGVIAYNSHLDGTPLEGIAVLTGDNAGFVNSGGGAQITGNVYVGFPYIAQDIANLTEAEASSSTSSFTNQNGARIDGDVYVYGNTDSGVAGVNGYNFKNTADGVVTGDIYGYGNGVSVNEGDPEDVHLFDHHDLTNTGIVVNVDTHNHAVFNNEGSGTVQGDVVAKNHSTINNAATIGSASSGGNVTVNQNAALNNASTGTIFGNVTVASNAGQAAEANNAGTIKGDVYVSGDGDASVDNSGTVEGAAYVSDNGTFTNYAGGTVGNGTTGAEVTGDGTLVNKDGATIDGDVTVGVDVGDTTGDGSTFRNAGTINGDVTVHGGDGAYDANTANFTNWGNTPGTNVNADNYSYSINKQGATVGDVGLWEHARFDNYGTAHDVTLHDESTFINQVTGNINSVQNEGANFVNWGTVGTYVQDGGTTYNPNTMGSVTIINDGIFYNHSENPPGPAQGGTVTGDVIVGDASNSTDASAFHNDSDDTVLGNITVNSQGTFYNDGGTIGDSDPENYVDVVVNDQGTFESGANSNIYGNLTFNDDSSANIVDSNIWGHVTYNDHSSGVSDPTTYYNGITYNSSGTTTHTGDTVYAGTSSVGVEVTGTGTIVFEGGSVVNDGVKMTDGKYINDNSTVNGNVDLIGGGEFRNINGSIIDGNASISGDGKIVNVGEITGDANVDGGNFYNNAAGTVDGSANVSHGNFRNNGLVSGGAVLTGDGTFENNDYGTGTGTVDNGVDASGTSNFNNEGTVNADSTGTAVTLHDAATLQNQTGAVIDGFVRTYGTSELTNDGTITDNVGLNGQSVVRNNNLIEGKVTARDTSTFYSNGTVIDPINITDNAHMYVTDNSVNSVGTVNLTDNGALVIGGEKVTDSGHVGGNIHTGDVHLLSDGSSATVGGNLISINNDVALTADSGGNAIGNYLVGNVTGGVGESGHLQIGGDQIKASNNGGTLSNNALLGGNLIANILVGNVNLSDTTLDEDVTIGNSSITANNTGTVDSGSTVGANTLLNTAYGEITLHGNALVLNGGSISSQNSGTLNGDLGGNEILNVVSNANITSGALIFQGGTITAENNTIGNFITNGVGNATITGGALVANGGTIQGTNAYGNKITNTLETATISGANVDILGGVITGDGANNNTITNDIDPVISGPGYLHIDGGSISGIGNHNNDNVNTFTGDVATGDVTLGSGLIEGLNAYSDSITNTLDGDVKATGIVQLGNDELTATNGYDNHLSNIITGNITQATKVLLGGNAINADSIGSASPAAANTFLNQVGDITASDDVVFGPDQINGAFNINNGFSNAAGNVTTDGDVLLYGGQITGVNNSDNSFANSAGDISAVGGVVQLAGGAITGNSNTDNTVSNEVGAITHAASVYFGDSAISGTNVSGNEVFNQADSIVSSGDVQLNNNSIDGANASSNKAYNSVSGDVTSNYGAVSLTNNNISGTDTSSNDAHNWINGNVTAQTDVTMGGNSISGLGGEHDNSAYNRINGSLTATTGDVVLGSNAISGANAYSNSAYNQVGGGITANLGAVTITGNTVDGYSGQAGANKAYNRIIGDITAQDAVLIGGNYVTGSGQGNQAYNSISGNVTSQTGGVDVISNVVDGDSSLNNDAHNFITGSVSGIYDVNVRGNQVIGNMTSGNKAYSSVGGDLTSAQGAVNVGANLISGDQTDGNRASNSVGGNISAHETVNLGWNQIEGFDAENNDAHNVVTGDIESLYSSVNIGNNGVDGNSAAGNKAYNTAGDVTAHDNVNVGWSTVSGEDTDGNQLYNSIGNVTTQYGGVNIGNNTVTGENAGNNDAHNTVGDIDSRQTVNVGWNVITGKSTFGNTAYNAVGAITSQDGDVNLGYNTIEGESANNNSAGNTVSGDVSANGNVVIVANAIDGISSNNNAINNTVNGAVTSAVDVVLAGNAISGDGANNNAIGNTITGDVNATGTISLGGGDSISSTGAANLHDNSIANSVGGTTTAEKVLLGGGSISGLLADTNTLSNTVTGDVTIEDGVIGLLGGDISGITNGNDNTITNRIIGDVVASGNTYVEFSHSVAKDSNGNFVRNVINGDLTLTDDSYLSVTGNDNRVTGANGVIMNGNSGGGIGVEDVNGPQTQINSLNITNGGLSLSDDATFGIGSGNTVTGDGSDIRNALYSAQPVTISGAGNAAFTIGSGNTVAGNGNQISNKSNAVVNVNGGAGFFEGIGTIVNGDANFLINNQNGDVNVAAAGSVASVGGATVVGNNNDSITNNINGNVAVSAGQFQLGTQEGDITGSGNILNNNIYNPTPGTGNLAVTGTGSAIIGGAVNTTTGDNNQTLNAVWGGLNVDGAAASATVGGGQSTFAGDDNYLGNIIFDATTVQNGAGLVIDAGDNDASGGSGNTVLNHLESTLDVADSDLRIDAGTMSGAGNTQGNQIDGLVTTDGSFVDIIGDGSDQNTQGNDIGNTFGSGIVLNDFSYAHVTGANNDATTGGVQLNSSSLQIDGRGVNGDLQHLINSLDGDVTLNDSTSVAVIGSDNVFANNIDGNGNQVDNQLNGDLSLGSGLLVIGGQPASHAIDGDANQVTNTINGEVNNLQSGGRVVLNAGDYAVDGNDNHVTDILTQDFDLVNGNSLYLNGGNLTTDDTNNTLNNIIDGNVNVGSVGNSNSNLLVMQGGAVNPNSANNFASDANGNAVNNVIKGAVNVYDGGAMTVNGENNYVVGGVTAGDPGYVVVGSNDVTAIDPSIINNTLTAQATAEDGGRIDLGHSLGALQTIDGTHTITNTITSGFDPTDPTTFLNGKVTVKDGGILTLGSGNYAITGSNNEITNILGSVDDESGVAQRQVQTVTNGGIVQLGGGTYTASTGSDNVVNNTLDQGLQVTDSYLNFAGAVDAISGNVAVNNTITQSVAANGTTAVNFYDSNGDNVINTIVGHLSLNDSSTLFAQDGSAAGGGNVVQGYINLNGTEGAVIGNTDLTANSDNSLNATIHFRNGDAHVAIGDSGAHSDGTVTNTHYGVIDTTVDGEGGLVQLSGNIDHSTGTTVSITNTQNGDVTLDGTNSTVLLTGTASGATGSGAISNNINGNVDVTDGKVLLLNGSFTGSTGNTLTNTVTGNVDLHSTGYLLFNGDLDTADTNPISNHITGIATLNDSTDTFVKGDNNTIDGGLVLNTTTTAADPSSPVDYALNDVTEAIIGGGDDATIAINGNVVNTLTSDVTIKANPNSSTQRDAAHGYTDPLSPVGNGAEADRGYNNDSGHLLVGAYVYDEGGYTQGNKAGAGQSITNTVIGDVTVEGGTASDGTPTGGMIVIGASANELTDGAVVTNQITGTVKLEGGSRMHMGGDSFTDSDGTGVVNNQVNGDVDLSNNAFLAMWGDNVDETGTNTLNNKITGALTVGTANQDDHALLRVEGENNSVDGGVTLNGSGVTELGVTTHGPGSLLQNTIDADFTLNDNSRLQMGNTGKFVVPVLAGNNTVLGDVTLNDQAVLDLQSGGTGGLHSAAMINTISGDLTLSGDSTYDININQQVATGVKVGGDADLNGATVHLDNLDANGLFNFGREYNILNADNVVTQFSGVDKTGLAPALNPTLVQNGTDVNLQMLTQFANNPLLPGTVNEQNFAEYLDLQSPVATNGGMNGVNDDLNNLLNELVANTNGDLSHLDNYLGDTYAAFDAAGYWNANRFANRVATHALQSRDSDWVQSFALNSSQGLAGVGSQMSLVKQLLNARPQFGFVSTSTQVVDYDKTDEDTTRNGLWADVAGDWINNDGDSYLGSPEWKQTRKSVLLGYQGGSKSFTWGVVGGYHDGDISFDNRSASGDQDGWDFGLNGLWQKDSGLYANGVLAYNRDSNDLTRNDGIGANKSSFNSHTLSAMLEVGKRIKRENNLTFTPYLSLLGVKYDRNGAQESGSGAGLNVNGTSHSYLTSQLGVRVGKDFLEKDGSKRGGVMLGLSWLHQFSGTDFPVTAALQSAMPGTGTYRVYGTPLSSNSIGVQLGGYGRLSRDVLGFLNYSGNFSSNQKVHSITAGVEYQF